MGCITSCATGIFVRILSFILGLIKIAAAVAILVIVPYYLVDVSVKVETEGVTSPSLGTVDCYLGSFQDELLGDEPVNLCVYAYVVAGVSLVVTMLLFFFLCLTCSCCGCGWIFETLFAVAGTAWWLAAAIVFTKYGKEANDMGFTEQDWRMAVIAAAWVGFGAFALSLLIAIFKVFDKLCCCCPCV